MEERVSRATAAERIASYPREANLTRIRASGPPARRKAVAGSIAGTLLPWAAFYVFCGDPRAYWPGLQMDAQPFYRDQEFWEYDVLINTLLGIPGLLIAATILAGTRWPVALARGLLIAPVHAVFAILIGGLTLSLNDYGPASFGILLLYLGFSWVWAHALLRMLERFTGREESNKSR